MVVYTDVEISQFINEAKILPDNYYDVLITQLKIKGAFKRSTLEVRGSEQNVYHIDIRQSTQYNRDFSVILRVEQRLTTGYFILRRYNGSSHWHTNVIEGESAFRSFHIHHATQRYQEIDRKPEHYAEPTDRYSDIVTALDCMIDDCGFIRPSNNRRRLI